MRYDSAGTGANERHTREPGEICFLQRGGGTCMHGSMGDLFGAGA